MTRGEKEVHLCVPAAASEFGADGGGKFVVEREGPLTLGELRDLVVVEVVQFAEERLSQVVEVGRERGRRGRGMEWGASLARVGRVSRRWPV